MVAIASFASVTVTVQRPSQVVDHGRSVPDYANLSAHEEQGGIVQPQSSSENASERDLTTSTRLVLLPPTADVKRFDLLEIPGETGRFRVEGEPALWDSPTGSLSHLAVTATRLQEGTP